MDYYHAVEHLQKVADLCKNWSAPKSKDWMARNKKHLRDGHVETVIKAINELVSAPEIVRDGTHFPFPSGAKMMAACAPPGPPEIVRTSALNDVGEARARSWLRFGTGDQVIVRGQAPVRRDGGPPQCPAVR